MSRVWEDSQHKGSRLLLLLALADHCDHEGVCWPGVARLAQKTRVTERQVQYHLRALEDSGELISIIQPGREKSNRYFVTVGLDAATIAQTLAQHPQLKGEEDCTINGTGEKVKSSAEKGEIQRTEKVKSIAPEPSLEPSSNRHEEHDRASAPQAAPPQKEPTPAQSMFSALASVCRIDLGLMSDIQRRQLNQSGKKLRNAKVTPDDVRAFEEYWRQCDWRAKNGDAPRPHQVREEWGKFKAWKENGKQLPKALRKKSNLERSLENAGYTEGSAFDGDV